jgi:hypothetical protein
MILDHPNPPQEIIDFYNDFIEHAKTPCSRMRRTVEGKAKGYVFDEKNLINYFYDTIPCAAQRFDKFAPLKIQIESPIWEFAEKTTAQSRLGAIVKVNKTETRFNGTCRVDPITWTFVPFYHVKKPGAYCPKAAKGYLER